MCKSDILRNRLTGYLAFKLVIGNMETTDRLTGYSVKVHSTTQYSQIGIGIARSLVFALLLFIM